MSDSSAKANPTTKQKIQKWNPVLLICQSTFKKQNMMQTSMITVHLNQAMEQKKNLLFTKQTSKLYTD